MPIKNIIHKVLGGVVNAHKIVKNIASRVVQISNEIASVFIQVFFQTAVNTKSKINVTGIA